MLQFSKMRKFLQFLHTCPPYVCESYKFNGKNDSPESVCSVLASFRTRTMDCVVVQAGEHRGGNFNKMLTAVVLHDQSIGNEHWMKEWKPQRIYIG